MFEKTQTTPLTNEELQARRIEQKKRLNGRQVKAIGATMVTGLALIAGTSNGREIVSSAWNEIPPATASNSGKGTETHLDDGEAHIGSAHIAYAVEAGDTEFTIAAKLFPDKDPREVAYEMIDPQLSDDARKDHMLQPGQVLEFER